MIKKGTHKDFVNILSLRQLLLAAFIITLLIYFVTSAGNTPYDYFTRLAESFVNGRYWLTEQPPWLSELVPVSNDRYFVIQPPMPAILSTPLVYLFGNNFKQQYLAHILGAATVSLTILMSTRIKKDNKLAIWSALLLGVGSIFWYLAATGSVWYLGQVTAAFFLTAALTESLGKKRVFLVGLFIGAAYLSRIHLILSLPLFIYLLRDKLFPNKKISILLHKPRLIFSKKYFPHQLQLALGMLPFFLFNATYNFVRFGAIWDKGYFLIPGILDEPWFSRGMLNPVYIKDHLRLLFVKLPNFIPNAPYVQPSWEGLAIWITTPAFIFSLKASLREGVVKMAWFTILIIFLMLALRGGTGWTQFGYRYAVDFYPFLMLLTIKGVASMNGPKWYHWLLLVIGFIVNLWGVLWINTFGWVSF